MKYTPLIILGLFWLSGHAQSYLDTSKDIFKTNKEINLDGFLDEPLWKDAQQFQFTEYSPSWGRTDSLTTLYMTFDTDFLYIGFDAKDTSPDKVIRRTLVRDAYYGDDYTTIYIDPNRTGKNAFLLSVYASGARLDHAIYNDNVQLGRSSDGPSYDMIWEGKSQSTLVGWQTEYRIPLSNLRFEIREGKVLGGISAVRTINHQNKVLVYPKLSQEITGAIAQPSLKQPVNFVGLRPKKDLQITPYVLAASDSKYQIDPSNSDFTKVSSTKINAGLDVRVGVTPSLTLDLTLNTDFSQVDIDNQIVNLDRASIFLPERRKFFLQQAGLFVFNTGLKSQLFYSRTIGINNGQLTPIIGGAKLTGELGNWDVGLISLQTEGIRLENSPLPSENFSVLRLRRKVFNKSSFIGVMATNRIRDGYFNTALGVDGVFDLGKQKYLIGSVSSTVENKDKEDNSSIFMDNTRIALQFTQRKQEGWFTKGAYEYSGKAYNPEMGFIQRREHQNFHSELDNGKFTRRRDKGFFNYRRITVFNFDVFSKLDLSKALTWVNQSGYTGRFFSGEEVSIFGGLQYEFLDQPLRFSNTVTIPTGNYFFKYMRVGYKSANRSALKTTTSIRFGEFFDGTNLEFQFAPEWNINKHISLFGSWRLNHLVFQGRAVDEWINVPQVRLKWAYDLHLSGGITAQYNSISDKMLMSARVQYNFKDGHNLFLVYNQDYNTMRGDLLNPTPYYNNQVFVAKYSYTFIK